MKYIDFIAQTLMALTGLCPLGCAAIDHKHGWIGDELVTQWILGPGRG